MVGLSAVLCRLGLGLGLTLATAACTNPPSSAGSSAQPTPAKSDKLAEVVFHPASGGPAVPISVELARTPSELSRGLMFRKKLEDGTGMLFLFEDEDIRRFWMRNTYIPLDMIFLDSKKVVVGVEENTVPLDETGRGPNQPAQYVVEVRGGYARSHGILPGSRAEFKNVP